MSSRIAILVCLLALAPALTSGQGTFLGEGETGYGFAAGIGIGDNFKLPFGRMTITGGGRFDLNGSYGRVKHDDSSYNSFSFEANLYLFRSTNTAGASVNVAATFASFSTDIGVNPATVVGIGGSLFLRLPLSPSASIQPNWSPLIITHKTEPNEWAHEFDLSFLIRITPVAVLNVTPFYSLMPGEDQLGVAVGISFGKKEWGII